MDPEPRVSVEAAIEHCRAVTYRSKNNLALAARRLPHPTQQRLFVTTYASMRVMDDYVDEVFLAREFRARNAHRDDATQWLSKFRSQVHAAGRGEAPSDRALEPAIHLAMQRMLGASDLGTAPWDRLTDALVRDVNEKPVRSWEDYYAYCQGACVAPASVFIYVLGCEIADDDVTRHGLPQALDWYAEDLAVFSYLVHMLRDLETDASQNAQLLTIPRDEIVSSGLSLDEVRRSARLGHWRTLRPLVTKIVEQADAAGRRARDRMAEARHHFRPAEWAVLQQIAQMYQTAYGQALMRLLGEAHDD